MPPGEAERAILNASRPFPMRSDGGKWRVIGPGDSNRPIEVVFVYDDDKTRDMVYVIHAMPTAGHRSRKRKPGR